jgi:Na+-driven multidrug efflux pump
MDLSLPLVVQNLLSMGSWFIFFVFIEKYGKHELAISNIVRGAYMISMTPIWGFSVAANSMISNIIGQKRDNEVFELLNKIMKLTLIFALIMIAINIIMPVQLMSLFTNDLNLVKDSLGCLKVVDFAMIFFSSAIVAISAVSGTGATRMALKIEIAAIFIYLVYNYTITFVFHGSMVQRSDLLAVYWYCIILVHPISQMEKDCSIISFSCFVTEIIHYLTDAPFKKLTFKVYNFLKKSCIRFFNSCNLHHVRKAGNSFFWNS